MDKDDLVEIAGAVVAAMLTVAEALMYPLVNADETATPSPDYVKETFKEWRGLLVHEEPKQ